ncbi:hypothetical protein VKT23_011646 [Stygiomarasmius scandens]|uniref:Uncharacterized protein n=1 Tax=Marasmiellus scandens TaxID=2682957 RepID=A0ABR1J8G1_9AGAR
MASQTTQNTPRITAALVWEQPDLILHSSKPGTPLHSFDGQAGAVILDSGYFVTSPNMDVIYAPSLKLCSTRMHRDFHFGKDDPIYFPQPFHSPIAHLAVIPVPSILPDHNLALAWYQPTSHDFGAHHSSGGLGLLTTNLTEQLQSWLKWLLEYSPRLQDIDKVHPVDRAVMGAFVEDLDTAAQLFQAGIPVWLVRSVELLPGVRVDALADPIDKNAYYQIPICDSGAYIDASDASPPHRIIYSGLPNKAERYTLMGRYIRGLFSYSIMGTFGPSTTPSTSVSTSSSTLTSTTSTAQSPLVKTDGKGPLKDNHFQKRKPYARSGKQTPAKASDHHNKFVHIDSPHNVPAVPCWATAQAELAPLSNRLPASNLGYCFLLPEAFLASNDDILKSRRICAWIKLHEIFQYHVSSSDSAPQWLRPVQWKSILELASGLKYSADTKTGQTHGPMSKLLAEYLADTRHGIRLDMMTLASVPTS